jgi:hypothetical protein
MGFIYTKQEIYAARAVKVLVTIIIKDGLRTMEDLLKTKAKDTPAI